MHREYKRRKIIIFSLIGILLLMAVGYSAFQTKLNMPQEDVINFKVEELPQKKN